MKGTYVLIGELGEETGLHKSTIRYYAERGLLPYKRKKHDHHRGRQYRLFPLNECKRRIAQIEKVATDYSLDEIVKQLNR